MRISGGILRSRRLRVPPGIRPTQDRVREALFSSLGARVAGARVLDLYAGSGALGIEAWSRGAAHVCAVEYRRSVFRVLRKNVETLCAGEPGREVAAVLADAVRFLKRHEPAVPYDLVLADPPYETAGSAPALQNALRLIRRRHILARTGVLVYEQAVSGPPVETRGWKLLQVKTYGATQLLFFTPVGGEGGEESGGQDGDLRGDV